MKEIHILGPENRKKQGNFKKLDLHMQLKLNKLNPNTGMFE